MRRLAFVALLFAALSASASLQELKITTYVVDTANILPADVEQALNAKLHAYATRTTRQFLVVTTPSVAPYATPSEAAEQLFRRAKPGAKERDNGLLLLVAMKERRVQFEVGYGLEYVLTDAKTSRLAREQLVPKFKAKDYAAGVVALVDATIRTMDATPAEDTQRVAALTVIPGWVQLGIVLLVVFVIGLFILFDWLVGRDEAPAYPAPKPYVPDADRWRTQSSGGYTPPASTYVPPVASPSYDDTPYRSSSSSSSSDSSPSIDFSGGGGESGGGGGGASW